MRQDWKPHTGQRIERLYAWVATEPDGGEGICACQIGGEWMALIGADKARIESLRDAARYVTTESGCPVRLVMFETRTVLEDAP